MEFAKFGYSGAVYNLARSGITQFTSLDSVPGGPFRPALTGPNFAGHERLKEVIAEWYGARPENVLLAQGASQCDFLIAGAALSGGGEAIFETPTYEPPRNGVEVWSERVVDLPRRMEHGCLPDAAELKSLLTDRTRLVCLTNLHNPTNVCMSGDLVRGLVETASTVGATVMVDEVFLPWITRDHREHGFASGAVSINGLDKCWGLDGLRVGWAVGPADLIRRAYRLNNLLGVNQPYMTEDLAWRIMSSPAAIDFLIRNAAKHAEGRSLFDEFVRQTPRAHCVIPAAGITALVILPAGTDDIEFTRGLLTDDETIVFPGSLFNAPGSVRVSFGGPQPEMREGLARLSRRIHAL